MKESITARVGRIISGSLNALIDAVEDSAPEWVMEQAIREIDGAIDEVRAELGRVIAAKHLANQRLMDEGRRHDELAGQIELAVKKSRDDLAEAAIARQLDIEAQIPVLETTLSECSTQERELEGFIAALQAKRREMKEELKQFRQSQQESAGIAASTGAAGAASGSVQQTVSKATSAFARVQERATGIAGRSSSGLGEAAKLAELEALARKNRIQERLAAVKNRSQAD